MNIINKNIDGGKAFDRGKTSADYAKYSPGWSGTKETIKPIQIPE